MFQKCRKITVNYGVYGDTPTTPVSVKELDRAKVKP
jgi:hypothetical protein